MSTTPWQLFHEIANPPSAKVRRYIVDHYLEETIRFRNVTYPEVQEALAAFGGQAAPALWDGEMLHQGAEAIIARLQTLTNIGRGP